MYLEGLGVEKNMDKALICLKNAASRGNVYAMGHLVAYYYRYKLYTKAVELAARYECSFCRKIVTCCCYFKMRLLQRHAYQTRHVINTFLYFLYIIICFSTLTAIR